MRHAVRGTGRGRRRPARTVVDTEESTFRCRQVRLDVDRVVQAEALLDRRAIDPAIYGMNFEHMPELKWEYGYYAALSLMVLLDVVLFVRFRKAGWI